MSIEQMIIGSGILIFLTIASGIWVSHSGKPYQPLIFTIHKLIALGMVAITAILIFNLFKILEINNLMIFLFIVSGVSAITLFGSGALMSIGKASYSLIKVIHVVATILGVVTIVLSLYLLLRM